MKIQVVTTTVETKPTAKGSYQQLEVVYKNLTFQGKIESKKLMSFGAGAPSFSTLSSAPAGSVFEISVVKNDKGFNDWLSATPSDAGAPSPVPAGAASVGGKSGATVTPKSTYETPEERALRQVLIVRQSSVSSAVAMLSIGAKAPLKVADVTSTAKELVDYVFGVGVVDTGASGFDDLPDFEGEVV